MNYLQTDKAFNQMINMYGCHFMSMINMAATVCLRNIMPDKIQFVYEDAITGDYMDRECTLAKPHMIANLVFKQFDLNITCRQIGALRGGIVTFWGRPVTPERISATILEGRTERGQHFRGGDQYCQLTYDPNPRAKVLEITRVLLYTVNSAQGPSGSQSPGLS